jgi:hypothetical protein
MAEETRTEVFDEFRQHSRAALRAWGDSWLALLPEGFLEKGVEGQKEALLAMRSLLDVAIDRLEGDDKPEPAPKK